MQQSRPLATAPPTVIWCNVLQDGPPLPWGVPCGTHLHYKLLVQ